MGKLLGFYVALAAENMQSYNLILVMVRGDGRVDGRLYTGIPSPTPLVWESPYYLFIPSQGI